MNINYLALTNTDTAGWHGQPCAELSLTGPVSASLPQLVRLADQILSTNNWKNPVMLIEDSFSPPATDPLEVLEFCSVLRQKGWFVIGRAEGTAYPRWLEQVDYRIAVIDNGEWIGWTANEINYRPRDLESMAEPAVGRNNTEAVKAVVPPPGMTMASYLDFLRLAQFSWVILEQPQRRSIVYLS